MAAPGPARRRRRRLDRSSGDRASRRSCPLARRRTSSSPTTRADPDRVAEHPRRRGRGDPRVTRSPCVRERPEPARHRRRSSSRTRPLRVTVAARARRPRRRAGRPGRRPRPPVAQPADRPAAGPVRRALRRLVVGRLGRDLPDRRPGTPPRRAAALHGRAVVRAVDVRRRDRDGDAASITRGRPTGRSRRPASSGRLWLARRRAGPAGRLPDRRTSTCGRCRSCGASTPASRSTPAHRIDHPGRGRCSSACRPDPAMGDGRGRLRLAGPAGPDGAGRSRDIAARPATGGRRLRRTLGDRPRRRAGWP